MSPEDRPGRSHWLSGTGSTEWKDDDGAYAALLEALTRDLAEAEATDLELTATSRRDMADVLEEESRIERDHLAEAHAELRGFREALRDARARSSPERPEATYDAAIPEENTKANTLIQYLVRPGYAEVRTEEIEPGHHRYAISVDWERLRRLAGK